ncbi:MULTISPECIES: hypothetical protein [Streptomyces]|uniref:hypothetical protein n=1 Tax=Streptomyces TaxID=1883 RepID=UPI00131A50AB|nr:MULTISPECIES: hypothetical protein [Streptomyces]
MGSASCPEGFLKRGDGRGRLRVLLLPEGLPVASELAQRGVGRVDGDDQARHVVQVAVEVEAAFQYGGEVDQGIVDAGDVAAVGHRRQGLRPQVGDPLGVQDQGVGAMVEELGGQGAQHRGAAAAAGGADQDVRGFGIQVDGDGPPGGADADERGSLGPRLYLLAQAGGAEAQHRRERGLLHGGVFLFCVGLAIRLFSRAGGSCRRKRTGPELRVAGRKSGPPVGGQSRSVVPVAAQGRLRAHFLRSPMR